MGNVQRVASPLSTAVDEPFRADRLVRLSEIEAWHFWFAGRRELIDTLLDRYLAPHQQVLDVGCGTGRQLGSLARKGHRAVGLDLRPEGLRGVRDGGASVVQGQVTELPLRPGSLDAAVLMDVLEHVDDGAALAEVRDVLREGGFALVSVPAFPQLWSYRDRDAGHQRRYTRADLTALLSNEGFQVLQVCYYQCLLFPVLVLSRWLGRGGPGWRDFEEQRVPVLNSALTWINRMEARLAARVRLPWGSTLVAACRKQK